MFDKISILKQGLDKRAPSDYCECKYPWAKLAR